MTRIGKMLHVIAKYKSRRKELREGKRHTLHAARACSFYSRMAAAVSTAVAYHSSPNRQTALATTPEGSEPSDSTSETSIDKRSRRRHLGIRALHAQSEEEEAGGVSLFA